MEEIVNKLESTGCEVNIRNCGVFMTRLSELSMDLTHTI